jgi:hypothetical protein
MNRVVNRLDDDWSDNFVCDDDDPVEEVDWSWNPPDWAKNQLGARPRVRESRRKVKAVPAR